MSRIRALLVVAALGASPAGAQQAVPLTFPTDDATLKRIWSVGMDSSQVQQLAHVLLDSVGPRLTGTPGSKSASDWVVKMYKQWGIEARQENYGTWRGWRRGTSHIDLVSPRVRSLEGAMLAWSPGTNGRAVSAEVVVLPRFKDNAEFVAWLPQARGKVILLSAALPTCRASEDWYRFATLESRLRIDSLIRAAQAEWSSGDGGFRGTGLSAAALNTRLDQSGVAGVITSGPTLGPRDRRPAALRSCRAWDPR